MSVDIEKICRTCLALSGPLLSIFDGSSGCGSGCVADMLRDFTKMQPKPTDNLPEKVCLTCISEINRCYSFKMKCENSNKTLRQLLHVLDEVEEHNPELPEPIVIQVHKGVQTMKEEKKSMIVAQIQTETEQVQHRHQCVQTEFDTRETTTSSMNNKLNKQELTTILKIEEATAQEDVQHITGNDCKLRVLRPKSVNSKEVKFKQLHVRDVQDQNDDDIIFELQTENVEELNSMEDANDVENVCEGGETEATAYYVYSELHESDKAEVLYDSEAELQIGNNEDEDTSQKPDYNFTIIQTEEGKEELTPTVPSPKRSRRVQSKVSMSTRNAPVQKREYQSSDCDVPLASIKLNRRCVRTHHSKKKLLKKLPVVPKATPQQTRAEEEVNIELSDDLQTTILQELDEEVVSEREENQLQAPNPEMQTPVLSAPPSTPTVFCPRCNAGFAYRKSLNYHMKQNQCTIKTFSCTECQRVFTSEAGLEEHQESHMMQHTCTECNKMFDDKVELSQHLIEVHNRSKRNQCKICQKVFTMVSALKDHLRIHSGEKPFLCQTCGKAFRQNANLKQHVMRHSKIKPYKCDVCSVSFVSKGELFSHKRTHTGDHPFKCDFCDRNYTTSSSLVKHKRKHTGERPYACEFCPMRFGALNVLKNHRRTHTGEKPFNCIYCNKGFTQKSDCQIHQRTHTGEKRYSCLCGASFTHLSSMRIHQKVHVQSEDGTTVRKRRKVKTEIAHDAESSPQTPGTPGEFNSDDDTLQDAEEDAALGANSAETDEYMQATMEDMC